MKELASNRSSKYSPRKHTLLENGDLVAVKQDMTKPYFYPIGLVLNTELNDLEEVASVSIRKSNGEKIRRHPSDIILLSKNADSQSENIKNSVQIGENSMELENFT